MTDRVVTRAQVAQWLGRSPRTVRTWEQRGRISRVAVHPQTGAALYRVHDVARQCERAEQRQLLAKRRRDDAP